MKYQASFGPLGGRGQVDPLAGASAEPLASPGPLPDRAAAPTATIEELTGADLVRVAGPAARWLRFAIVIGAAAICLGFAGHAWGSPVAGVGGDAGIAGVRSASPAPVPQVVPTAAPRGVPFVIVSAAEGEISGGEVVSIHGIANESLRDIHLAVVLGDAELGSLDLGSVSAGPVRADIPVIAPGFDVPVNLEVSASTLDGSSYRLAHGLVLGVGRRISLWRPTTTALPGGAVGLAIDGCGPSTIDLVRVVVRTRAGRLLASTITPNAVADERPGPNGGRRRGLGSFHAWIVVPGPIPTAGWQVEISWRDELDGSSGSAAQVVPAVGR